MEENSNIISQPNLPSENNLPKTSKPKGLRSLIAESIDEFLSNFKKIFIIVIGWWVISTTFLILNSLTFKKVLGNVQLSPLEISRFFSYLFSPINLVIFYLIFILYILFSMFPYLFVINFIFKKNELSLKDIFSDSLRKFPKFILTSFTMTFFLFAISVFSIPTLGILSIVLFPYYIFIFFVFINENLGGTSALIRSRQIVKGHWFKVVGNVLVWSLIIVLFFIPIVFISAFLGIIFPFLPQVFFGLSFFTILVLSLIFLKNLYLTLKETKELPEIEKSSINKYRIITVFGLIIWILFVFLLSTLFKSAINVISNFNQFLLNKPNPLLLEEKIMENFATLTPEEDLMLENKPQEEKQVSPSFDYQAILNQLQSDQYSINDEKRTNDLILISSILDFLYVNNGLKLKPNVVYLSLKDVNEDCSSYLNVLPKLPSDWSYHCSSNPSLKDGKGWIPLNLSGFNDLKELPVDPINNYPYIYTLVIDKNGDYELTTKLDLSEFFEESEKIFFIASKEEITPSTIRNR